MTIKFKKVHEDARTPVYSTPGSSGFDLYSVTDVLIRPGDRVLVKTGIVVDLPKGYELQVRPRSGLALKYGITVLNTPGTVDSDYTGEIGVILINHDKDNYLVRTGDRIAQGVIAFVGDQVVLEEVEDLNKETDRGAGGFGSTGTN